MNNITIADLKTIIKDLPDNLIIGAACEHERVLRYAHPAYAAHQTSDDAGNAAFIIYGDPTQMRDRADWKLEDDDDD